MRCEFVARDGPHERAEGRALLVEVGEHRRYGAFLFGDECKAFVELRKKIALDLVEQVGLTSVVLVKSSAVYLGGLAYLGRSRSWVFSVTSYACKSISMWAFPLRQ